MAATAAATPSAPRGTLAALPSDELGSLVLSCCSDREQAALRRASRAMAHIVATVCASDAVEAGLQLYAASAADAIADGVGVTARAAAFAAAVSYDGYRLGGILRRTGSTKSLFRMTDAAAAMLQRCAAPCRDVVTVASASARVQWEELQSGPFLQLHRDATETSAQQVMGAPVTYHRQLCMCVTAPVVRIDDGAGAGAAFVHHFWPHGTKFVNLPPAAVAIDAASLSTRAVTDIARCCPNVVDVKLRGAWSAVVAMAEHYAGLTALDVSNNELVNDKAIRAVAEHCRKLRTLVVSGTAGRITNRSIVAIAENCPELATLAVRSTRHQVTDVGILAIARNCPKLTSLDLGGNYGAIMHESIAALGKHCPELRFLDISNSFGTLTDEALVIMAEGCPHLTSLNLADNRGTVTSSAIVAIAKRCLMLQTLCLADTLSEVDDTAIIAVAHHCRHLTNLDVSQSRYVSGTSIVAVAEHCPELAVLELRNTSNVTDATLAAVARHCPKLTTLSVRGVVGISDGCFEQLKARWPLATIER